MPKDTVLIVSNKDDPHADYISPLILAKGCRVFRFNTEEFPTRTEAKIGVNSEGFIKNGSNLLELSSVRSVWYRRPMDAEADERIQNEAAKELTIRESREFTESLWFALDAKWVNHPYYLKRASRKLEQLRVAKLLGWEIPPTIITNSPEEVASFILEQGQIVAKTLYSQFTIDAGQYKSFFTHFISSLDGQTIEDIKTCPSMFQKAIEKNLELRITVIGDRVFAASANTQLQLSTSEDWRRDMGNVSWVRFDLPSDIQELSRRITGAFNLHFSSMDVILTPEGDYVFLDLNPNGQWLWVEQETKMPLAECFVDFLVKP